MNGFGLATKLSRAIKAAEAIERGTREPTLIETGRDRSAELVKHYTVYSIVGDEERPIAWRLYSGDVPYIIAAAQRRMLRAYESIVIGDPLYVSTRFEAKEETWS